MPRRNFTRGQDLAERFLGGRRQAQRAARPGSRDLPTLRGVTPQALFTNGQENVLIDARNILVESERVYQYGDSIVMEVGDETRQLVPLMEGGKMEPAAPFRLGNLFCCEVPSKEDTQQAFQFAPRQGFVQLLLHSLLLIRALPTILLYATRPVFDPNFRFREPGWHHDVGYLIHGPAVEPLLSRNIPNEGPLAGRLPRRLRQVLGDFCFRTEADQANAVAALLTGLLIPNFVESGKPLCILDGNQPGVGKTLFARVCGMILDGRDPALLHYSSDNEELGKRICANLRGQPQSVLIIDNAKVKSGSAISSPVIESNSMAPRIALRILGQSTNYERPNDLLWFITMNSTKTSPDIVSRGLPIQFLHEGDPGRRNFAGRDPLALARQHRVEILGELAGMVIRWVQSGRELAPSTHRCTQWATVLGGILRANHLPEFLSNLDEAATEFNAGLDDLTALAEKALSSEGLVEYVTAPTPTTNNEESHAE